MLRSFSRFAYNLSEFFADVAGFIWRPLRGPVLSIRLALFRFLDQKGSSDWLRLLSTYSELGLLFDQRSPWNLMRSLIRDVKHPKVRAHYYQQAITLFWINGRFDEAREAALTWCLETEEMAKDHSVGMEEALQSLHKLPSWSLTRERSPALTMSEIKDIQSSDTVRMYGLLMQHYRDAHVTYAILQWSKLHNDVSAFKAVQAMLGNRRPIVILPLVFDYKVSEKIGVNDASFKRMCIEAENLRCS